MRNARLIVGLAAVLGVLALVGLPRPDDDSLSMRDPSGFGTWFGSPAEVQPLYRTLQESTGSPRRTWAVHDATRVELVFIGEDGSRHVLPLPTAGSLTLDSRNLDLSEGTLTARTPDDLGDLPVTQVSVDLLGCTLGTAPREVGARTVGGARLRVRAGARAVDLEGRFEVLRQGPERLVVTVAESPRIDLPDLGFEAALAPLARRFGVQWLETQASLELQLHLTPAGD